MTESAAIATEAEKACYKELDVDEYKIIATLDKRTSQICREMDGKHFPVSEMKAGVTAPPFHPWCRTDTAPYFDDWEEMGISPERAARDQADQVYYVPENMTYREWEKKCAFSKINQYKGSRTDAVDSTEVPENVQKDVNNAIEKIEKDFPSILELVQNILYGDCGEALGKNSVNITIEGILTHKIILNKSAFSNKESLLKTLSVDYLDGTSYNTDRIESLVAHELGHSAHHALIQKRIGYHGGKMTSKMVGLYKSQYDQILQEIYVTAFPDEDYPDITAQEIFKSIEAELGTMAEGDAAELIAQSFGNYYYGSKKSRVATKIVEWFKEELK